MLGNEIKNARGMEDITVSFSRDDEGGDESGPMDMNTFWNQNDKEMGFCLHLLIFYLI